MVSLGAQVMRFPSDLSAFLKLTAVSPRERHFHHVPHLRRRCCNGAALASRSRNVPAVAANSAHEGFRLHSPLGLNWVHNEGTQTKIARLKKFRKISGKTKKQQILPLRPAFLTREVVMGNDMGDETLALILVNHDLQRELLPRSPSK